ncbi:unnamed protein product [Polarella glacialis]|uniref:Uncharacterized protein n=1 Tax=Polarella glacialis TaxID=89957 RepID=A0A813KBX4_POLGL|nr:unnamed protein product [Polarella glacialis]
MAPLAEEPPARSARAKVTREWPAAYERLVARFPLAGPDSVAEALCDAAGHAGRAAGVLRAAAAAATSSASVNVTRPLLLSFERVSIEASASPRDHPSDSDAASASLATKRLRARLREEREGRCRGEDDDDVAEVKSDKPFEHQSHHAFCGTGSVSLPVWSEPCAALGHGASEDLVEQLVSAGRRLREELQAALAEVRAEHKIVCGADGHYPQEPTAKCARAAASGAVGDTRRLLQELQASRGEGCRLQQELSGALAAAAAASARCRGATAAAAPIPEAPEPPAGLRVLPAALPVKRPDGAPTPFSVSGEAPRLVIGRQARPLGPRREGAQAATEFKGGEPFPSLAETPRELLERLSAALAGVGAYVPGREASGQAAKAPAAGYPEAVAFGPRLQTA